jgi:hypothetical protein
LIAKLKRLLNETISVGLDHTASGKGAVLRLLPAMSEFPARHV